MLQPQRSNVSTDGALHRRQHNLRSFWAYRQRIYLFVFALFGIASYGTLFVMFMNDNDHRAYHTVVTLNEERQAVHTQLQEEQNKQRKELSEQQRQRHAKNKRRNDLLQAPLRERNNVNNMSNNNNLNNKSEKSSQSSKSKTTPLIPSNLARI